MLSRSTSNADLFLTGDVAIGLFLPILFGILVYSTASSPIR